MLAPLLLEIFTVVSCVTTLRRRKTPLCLQNLVFIVPERGHTPQKLKVSPGMGVDIPVLSPPFDLPDREIVDRQPAPNPLVLGAEPEFSDNRFRERELPQRPDLVREEIFVQ